MKYGAVLNFHRPQFDFHKGDHDLTLLKLEGNTLEEAKGDLRRALARNSDLHAVEGIAIVSIIEEFSAEQL